MARLKAHGIELDRREYATQRVAVMSDGNIMRDFGTGWKLWKRLKVGVDPKEYAAKCRASYNALPEFFHDYVKTLKDATGLPFRSRLHELVKVMPSDPDGVYSEFNDHTYGGDTVDLDDCVKLCRLYQAASLIPMEETNQ